MTTSGSAAPQRRATVVGAGLIGGSIGAALRARGWCVSGTDVRPGEAARAVELGAFDAVGIDADSEITFIATPVSAVAQEARTALAATRGVVTDVGSVKGEVAAAVRDPRFVGGHPMAGSEQLGVEGARPDLFQGAVWALTPSSSTADESFELVRAVVVSLDAEVLTLDPSQHDALVAVVSHVPHLTAASLMRVATVRSEEHNALLRLAAGGFRDMTRVAAGSPTIWPDICTANRAAILTTLDLLAGELQRFRSLVADGDQDGLLAALDEAQSARRNLPSRVAVPERLTEVRVPVRDEPGQVAAVAVLATDLGVNLRSLQTVDASEGTGGVLQLVLESSEAATLHDALVERGYRPSSQKIE